MNIEKQRELAQNFKQMHIDEEMFILPNVWNAGSAFICEKEGFKAVATTSAGVAYALGYSDAEEIDIDDLATVVKQITKRVTIPVSVDFERGYGEEIEIIKENAKLLLKHGAVGFNIEDGKKDGTLDQIEDIVKKIRALVEVKEETGIDFVINARTCTYWLDVADAKTKFEIAIKRGKAFKKAGADVIFVPGAIDKTTIENLVKSIDAPLNIILNPLFNDLEKLNSLGVRRLSIGSGLVRSNYNNLIELTKNLKKGDFSNLINNKFSYNAANNYFSLK